MASPLIPQPQASAPPQTKRLLALRVAPAGAGARWWLEGWRTFTSHIGTWLAIGIVYAVVSQLLHEIPNIGTFADWLLTPVFLGGLMLGCDARREGEPVRVKHLFDGFKAPHFIPLLLIGIFNVVLCLLAVIIAVIVFVAVAGVSALANLGTLATDPWQMWRSLGFAYLLLIALGLVIAAVIAMANWFAPALVVLRAAPSLAAMTASFVAGLRNWLPFLVYGAIGIVVSIVALCLLLAAAAAGGFDAVLVLLSEGLSWKSLTVATAPFAAAYLALFAILLPVLAGSTYASYRDASAAEDSGTAVSTAP
jgi:uncharacterized membrane protein